MESHLAAEVLDQVEGEAAAAAAAAVAAVVVAGVEV